MSVFTLVQRALNFALSFKRRNSVSGKGKEKEDEIKEVPEESRDLKLEVPCTSLRDVSTSSVSHVAVKPVDAKADSSASSKIDLDTRSSIDQQFRRTGASDNESMYQQLTRVISWANLVNERAHWTSEQEEELVNARKQLARCQKAWSSEQELWLDHIQILNAEKEAREGFLLLRAKQQDEERHQFRKAWKRRRSMENAIHQKLMQKEEKLTQKWKQNDKFGRLQRYGSFSLVPNLTRTMTAVAC